MNLPSDNLVSDLPAHHIAGKDVAISAPAPARPAHVPIRAPHLSATAFLARLAAAFVISFGAVWLYVLAMPMAYMNRDYPYLLAKRAMQAECRRDDVAVFGDSRAVAAINPAAIGVPVTNYAMSGTSPVETYFAVKRILSCPTPPKLIVIAHSPLKYSSDSDYWVFDARTGFLNYSEMRGVEADAAHLNDNEINQLRSADQLPGALRDWLFSIGFPPFYFDSLLNAFGAARFSTNRAALHDNLLSRGYGQFGSASGSSEVTGEAFAGAAYATSPLVDLYFVRTLVLAAQYNVPVYAISPPINNATCARIPPEQRMGFEAYLRSKAAGFPGLHVVAPIMPCWRNDMFGDAWHLNANGAVVYSRYLGDWLSGAYVGSPSLNIEMQDAQQMDATLFTGGGRPQVRLSHATDNAMPIAQKNDVTLR